MEILGGGLKMGIDLKLDHFFAIKIVILSDNFNDVKKLTLHTSTRLFALISIKSYMLQKKTDN